MELQKLIRKNIRELKPYSSARDEFSGKAEVYLDANENPFPSGFNRYPDPLQKELKEKISNIKAVPASQIFLGNGSDEAIDLIIRMCCEPGKDSVLITEPTYGMYRVCASVNNVQVDSIPLNNRFDLDLNGTVTRIRESTKVIFLCSPNNPTGNLLGEEKIEWLLNQFKGLIVLDEAYIDFARHDGFSGRLSSHPNLIILQTLSKAWGLAGLRLGMCFADEDIISILNKIKYPYNINAYTQQKTLEILDNIAQKTNWVKDILAERAKLEKVLPTLSIVHNVYPSDANFLLVKVINAKKVYLELLKQNIIVRDRSQIALCDNCLRITVGTPRENEILIQALKTL